ncbi:unnamed protein product [Nesidiocoris tenuis]|uniref:Uncharacterized protein n=1 Tax=Nesidiocoris tenuis TaxID=355587 RepID=A0A6H5G4P4_9HEMI|nr:unnamed protein product [Nesidiocoris tenuis]
MAKIEICPIPAQKHNINCFEIKMLFPSRSTKHNSMDQVCNGFSSLGRFHYWQALRSIHRKTVFQK